MERSVIGITKNKRGIAICPAEIRPIIITPMVLTFIPTMMGVMVGGGMETTGGDQVGAVAGMAAVGEGVGMAAGMVGGTEAVMAGTEAVGTVEVMVEVVGMVAVTEVAGMAGATEADTVDTAEVMVVVVVEDIVKPLLKGLVSKINPFSVCCITFVSGI